ncbi:MAG: DUF368 domain-containing protein [Deltaproteobacteria bacterium]|nr:DUF368 domain-containing protein [Deltaproteobacteria bacterium]
MKISKQDSKKYGFLFFKGTMMGAADVVPGVSGGTIAFIMGIYDQFVAAINSINIDAFRLLFKGKIREAFSRVHLSFLIPLGLGISFSIISLAKLVTWLITKYPVYVWSFFFGLIIASSWFVVKEIGRIKIPVIISLALGFIFAWLIVGIIPVSSPDNWYFTVFAGAISIIAMVLPGISGSFILLLIGQYERIMTAVKSLQLSTMATFSLGSALGILSFSRLLGYLLNKHREVTMAMLAGFMMGSLRKVWPYKEILEIKIVGGKEIPIKSINVLPGNMDGSFFFALMCAISGIVLVFVLEGISGSMKGDQDETA